MDFISLTDEYGNMILLNKNHIAGVVADGREEIKTNVVVNLHSGTWYVPVKESVNQILNVLYPGFEYGNLSVS